MHYGGYMLTPPKFDIVEGEVIVAMPDSINF